MSVESCQKLFSIYGNSNMIFLLESINVMHYIVSLYRHHLYSSSKFHFLMMYCFYDGIRFYLLIFYAEFMHM